VVGGSAFTVMGTAQDNGALSNVSYRLNGGAWTEAVGTTNWAAPVAPGPDTNLFEVFALDLAGNRSLTNRVSFLGNRPPLAASTNLDTAQNQPVSLGVTQLLAHCSDPDNDPLSLVSVSSSSNGAPVMLGGGQITYSPLTNFVGDDRFHYTLSDGRGGTAVGEVRVDVYPGAIPALHVVSAGRTANGFLFRFAGIPGRTYQVERSSAVSGPWNVFTNLVAPPGGWTDCEDAPLPAGKAFYRPKSSP
jgi:hypothetical protein